MHYFYNDSKDTLICDLYDFRHQNIEQILVGDIFVL